MQALSVPDGLVVSNTHLDYVVLVHDLGVLMFWRVSNQFLWHGAPKIIMNTRNGAYERLSKNKIKNSLSFFKDNQEN